MNWAGQQRQTGRAIDLERPVMSLPVCLLQSFPLGPVVGHMHIYTNISSASHVHTHQLADLWQKLLTQACRSCPVKPAVCVSITVING